jgi:hypothetical protein
MLALINSLLRTGLVLLLLFDPVRVQDAQGEQDEPSDLSGAEPDTTAQPADNEVSGKKVAVCKGSSLTVLYLGALAQLLKEHFGGKTCSYPCLQSYASNEQRVNNQIIFHFNSNIKKLFWQRLLVSGWNDRGAIEGVTVSFHHTDGVIVRDDAGQAIHYTSNHHVLGQVVDILHNHLPYAYARCRIVINPYINFNLKDLFFHYLTPPKFPTSKSDLL